MTDPRQMLLFENLRIEGTISVVPAHPEDINLPKDTIFILMGPTGSGKSSLIEAVASQAPGGPLGIAKDQLEGVTQGVEVYRIENLRDYAGATLYIVDTPGLADPKISELQILNQVQGWRDRCNQRVRIRLLYFHPITDIRLPASKTKCMEIVKAFWGAHNIPTVCWVTTMWDRITPDGNKMENAEARFQSLSDIHWGDWSDYGSQVVKFENTFESATSILDAISNETARKYSFPPIEGHGCVDPDTGVLVVEDVLRERVARLYQQIQSLDHDLNDPVTQANEELTEILLTTRTNAEETLDRFVSELCNFQYQEDPTRSGFSRSQSPSIASLSSSQGRYSGCPTPSLTRSSLESGISGYMEARSVPTTPTSHVQASHPKWVKSAGFVDKARRWITMIKRRGSSTSRN
ncbi:hypothetical protein BJ165DRAFT_1606828 [Panaeolus papilionaceus]|nr:hypothetical protein BJ165DRAFT_1606828 [Panaeolus papilionaceus]